MNGKKVMKRFSALFMCMVLFLTLLPVGFADSPSDYTLPAPGLVSLEKQGNALKLTWSGVSGITYYSVHRKDNGGPWHSIASVAGTSYLDTSIQTGNSYTYTVRCLHNSNITSYASWFNTTGLTYSNGWPYATPVLKSISSTENSITINWNAVAGAPKYSVHRRVNGGGWQTIARTTALTYTDMNVSAGNNYTYTVRVRDGADNFASWFNETGLSATTSAGTWPLATPVLVGANKTTDSSILVTWKAVSGASRYSVHRKINGGAWSTIGFTTGTSYTDTAINAGNTYTYTVRCVNNSGQFLSWFDAAGVTPSSSVSWPFTTPVLQTIKNGSNGVTITWGPVTGCLTYSVHRKVNGGGWQTIARVNTAHYTDPNVSSGNNYTYTVRCVNKAGQLASWFDETGLSISFFPCATPEITLTSTATGMQVSWGAVSGASQYRVFRKNDLGNWVRLGVTGATSFLDKNVVSGKTYTYTVRTLSGETYTSWMQEKTATFYADGLVVNLVLGNPDNPVYKGNCISLSWKNVQGAAGYRVFRKANGAADWKIIADNVSGTFYIDDKVVSATNYTYTVRGLDASGNYVGAYDANGKTIRYYDAPHLISATVDQAGVTVSWNPVVGAAMYQVYRKNTAGKWERIGSTGDLYFVDKNVEKFRAYTYTVLCLNSNSEIISGFDPTGVTSKAWYATPVLVDAKIVENNVEVTWKPVDGVAVGDYEVLRKTANTGWQTVTLTYKSDDLTHVTMVDKAANLVSGTTYWYTVRCTNGTDPISDYDPNGVSVAYYEVPPIRVNLIYNTMSGVYMKWNAVDGTGQYFIYRKVMDGNWIRLDSTTGIEYTDTTVANAVTYHYAIASADLGGTLLSDYFKTGSFETIKFYSTPGSFKAYNAIGAVHVEWKEIDDIDGTGKYVIYRKVAGASSWDQVGTSMTASFNDTTAASGTTYVYTVKATDGTYESAYDPNGITILHLATPTNLNAFEVPEGIMFTWDSVIGATGYQVSRRLKGAEKWDYVTTISSDSVTYVDTNILAGTEYEYTVRAENNGTVSDYDHTGASAMKP